MDWLRQRSIEAEEANPTRRFYPIAVARALVWRSSLAVRHSAASAARTMAADFSEWIGAAVQAGQRELLEWLRQARETAGEWATAARARLSPWVAAHRRAVAITAVALGSAASVAALGWWEVRTSWIEARFFSRSANNPPVRLEPGAAEEIAFPRTGPYDERLGYTRIPSMVSGLAERGFEITRQATRADDRSTFSGFVFPLYHEKTRAGLTVVDPSDRLLYQARFPRRVYASYDSVPSVVIRSLLFLENRELLDANGRYRNPAIEWDRLAAASGNLTVNGLVGSGHVYGGSTLATQMEKFRHSPAGLTQSPRDKLQQLASASARAYLDGPITVETRRRIVTDYVNSVPLGAAPGAGEVIGLADGLWNWFGLDFDRANRLLARADTFQRVGDDEARAYRSVLTLLVAQRRPAFYLAGFAGRSALERETDVQVRLLSREGIISPLLGKMALTARSDLRTRAPDEPPKSFVDRKAANAIRNQLLALLSAPGLHALDRYDVTVRSDVDSAAQQAVTDRLRRLHDPAYAHSLGLDAPKFLGRNDPGAVSYSVVLYERTPQANVLRVQADNQDVPFDLNHGARIELGSTAKVRTLVSYLEIIEQLHRQLPAGVAHAVATQDVAPLPDDSLTRWAREYHRAHPRHTAREMLDAALERKYSASPRERFFTGGGLQEFHNFDPKFDGSIMTIRDALANSVNLVFIRLMRDVVQYHIRRLPGVTSEMFTNAGDTARQHYLEQFVDRDSRIWLRKFYGEYRSVERDELVDSMAAAHQFSPLRTARVLRAVEPEADLSTLVTSLQNNTRARDRRETAEELFRRADPEGRSLSDLAYLSGVHPLELWTATYLYAHPGASWDVLAKASDEARRQSYGWLLDRKTRAQDRALDIALETEAFEEIHDSWQRLGYPYDDLVPSLGTTIGSSGDRPDALAELVGILLNDGLRLPMVAVEEVGFAQGTPYETAMRRVPEPADWVVSPDVAATARGALIGVVENGTASPLKGTLHTADGREVVIGGKTGTGQNQYKVFGPGLSLVETRSVSRTATFVFFIGNRFFGTITAQVAGAGSQSYEFTSALPVKLFSVLMNDVQPLMTKAWDWPLQERWMPSPTIAAPVAY
jgi:membrane peptidoglycan carboxypeptidase